MSCEWNRHFYENLQNIERNKTGMCFSYFTFTETKMYLSAAEVQIFAYVSVEKRILRKQPLKTDCKIVYRLFCL